MLDETNLVGSLDLNRINGSMTRRRQVAVGWCIGFSDLLFAVSEALVERGHVLVVGHGSATAQEIGL